MKSIVGKYLFMNLFIIPNPPPNSCKYPYIARKPLPK
jgi:hypothetical protein